MTLIGFGVLNKRTLSPAKKVFSVLHKTESDDEAPVHQLFEIWSTLTFLLIPGLHWPRLLVSVWFFSITRTDQIEKYLYYIEILDSLKL